MHYSFFFFRTTAAWAWGRARHGEKILIKPLPLRIATILTMAAASISPANSPVKRSTDGEKAPYGKKAKLGGLPITVGVVDCNGGGVRVLMTRPDSDHLMSIQKCILSTRDETSGFYGKFKGYKHTDDLTVDGIKFGKFSYSWKASVSDPARTADDLCQLLLACKHLRNDPKLPYDTPGNQRAKVVKLFGGRRVAIEEAYTHEDIITHLTSQQQRYLEWRKRVSPFHQQETFFWRDPSNHISLQELVDRHGADVTTAPVIGNITF